jgi:5'-nucleotidase
VRRPVGEGRRVTKRRISADVAADPSIEVAGSVTVERPEQVADDPWILVTNDDGVGSPGIAALADRLSRDHRVVVVAPSEDRSGSGTGIGLFDPVAGVELSLVADGHPQVFSIDGPPGLAVLSAALGAFGPSPRIVVSGVNAGINTGHSVIHSGTVGAALTARTFGSHGLAVSTPRSDPWQWDTAAEVASRVADWMLGRSGRPLALNLNVPAVPVAGLRGIRWADLAAFGHFQVAVRASGRLEFQVGTQDETPNPGSDTELLRSGFATLTSLAALQSEPPPEGGPGWPPADVSPAAGRAPPLGMYY